VALVRVRTRSEIAADSLYIGLKESVAETRLLRQDRSGQGAEHEKSKGSTTRTTPRAGGHNDSLGQRSGVSAAPGWLTHMAARSIRQPMGVRHVDGGIQGLVSVRFARHVPSLGAGPAKGLASSSAVVPALQRRARV